MKNVYLSKSKYCRAKQCNKMLWLDKNMPEVFEQTASNEILTNGAKVGELARGLFGKYVNIEYNQDLNVMVEQTKKYLKSCSNIITEASFNFDSNFCSVDILKNDIDGLEIYEVKSSTGFSELYLDDVSYQVYILLNLGYKVKSANIVYINNQYVRHGELEIEKLVEDIPENKCVLAYNMSFGKSRLIELAVVFPDLAEKLLNIRDNIKDLMVPFFNRMYYAKQMEGSYSIKAVLPTLYPDVPEYDYHNLELVHNGGEASEIFASLDGKTKEEQEKIKIGF